MEQNNSNTDISEAKMRLDCIFKMHENYMCNPIQIAEILYNNRVCRNLDVYRPETYIDKSVRWRNNIASILFNLVPPLNFRNQKLIFGNEYLSAKYISTLSKFNESNGIVEVYIYHHLFKYVNKINEVGNVLDVDSRAAFFMQEFLGAFKTNPILQNYVGKIYEIMAKAFFAVATKYINVTVTISSSDHSNQIWDKFTEKVLGLNKQRREISAPAKLYRVGATNVNDAGLDIWANYGPCVLVKHVTLSANHIGEISDEVHADQCIIVCRDTESEAIKQLLKQIGWDRKIRGIIVEKELIKWYDLSLSPKYAATIGKELLSELHREYIVEFPVNTKLTGLLKERKYSFEKLKGIWKV
jgi:hypothetical protein